VRRGAAAARFGEGALADAGQRAGVRYRQTVRPLESVTGQTLVEAALAVGARGIVTPYVPVGPTASALEAARPVVDAAGLALVMVRRPWDAALWPLATRGFFPFRQQSEASLRTLGLPL
jgi:deoxyribodipyrimidine photo-lyase